MLALIVLSFAFNHGYDCDGSITTLTIGQTSFSPPTASPHLPTLRQQSLISFRSPSPPESLALPEHHIDAAHLPHSLPNTRLPALCKECLNAPRTHLRLQHKRRFPSLAAWSHMGLDCSALSRCDRKIVKGSTRRMGTRNLTLSFHRF